MRRSAEPAPRSAAGGPLARRLHAAARGRVAQPLRVERGGVRRNLPVDYDYATLSPAFADSTLALTSDGSEVIGEFAWHGALWGGNAAASVFHRKDPGHFASVPDDKGLVVRWGREF